MNHKRTDSYVALTYETIAGKKVDRRYKPVAED